jgi:hypothetical protein
MVDKLYVTTEITFSPILMKGKQLKIQKSKCFEYQLKTCRVSENLADLFFPFIKA